MWGFLRSLLLLVLGVVFVFAVFAVLLLSRLGLFSSVEPVAMGTCSEITGPGSAEDLVIDRETGIIYLSAYDRIALAQSEQADLEGADEVAGVISPYDISLGAASFTMPEMVRPKPFRPHGVSLYADESGKKWLFAINHKPNDEAVEIFEVGADGSLIHMETISDPLFSSPNNLVVVGPRQFYIANDSGALGGGQRFADLVFGLGFLDLVYYDGTAAKIVANGLASAGGIAANADASQIYVALTSRKSVEIYDRNGATGGLKFKDDVKVRMGADNIDVAADGSLWVAGHPKFTDLTRHFISGGERPSPSKVVRIEMKNGTAVDAEPVYVNSGEEISASSVAAIHDGKMYVGSITAKKVLVCELPEALAAL